MRNVNKYKRIFIGLLIVIIAIIGHFITKAPEAIKYSLEPINDLPDISEGSRTYSTTPESNFIAGEKEYKKIFSFSDELFPMAMQEDSTGNWIVVGDIGWGYNAPSTPGLQQYISNSAPGVDLYNKNNGKINLNFRNNMVQWASRINGSLDPLILTKGKFYWSHDIFYSGGTQFTGFAQTKALIVSFYSDGKLNPSFGNKGILSLNLGGNQNFVDYLAVGPDDAIYAICRTPYTTILIKLNDHGELDRNFGQLGNDGHKTGIVHFEEEAENTLKSINFTKENEIITFGAARDIDGSKNSVLLTKLDKNGNFDKQFGKNGIAERSIGNIKFDPEKSIIEEDGKIVTAISIPGKIIILIRFTQDGIPDASFGNNGQLNLDPRIAVPASYDKPLKILATHEGRLIVAGYFEGPLEKDHNHYTYFFAQQFDKDGKVDSTYGKNGIEFENMGSLPLQNKLYIVLRNDGTISTISNQNNVIQTILTVDKSGHKI